MARNLSKPDLGYCDYGQQEKYDTPAETEKEFWDSVRRVHQHILDHPATGCGSHWEVQWVIALVELNLFGHERLWDMRRQIPIFARGRHGYALSDGHVYWPGDPAPDLRDGAVNRPIIEWTIWETETGPYWFDTSQIYAPADRVAFEERACRPTN